MYGARHIPRFLKQSDIKLMRATSAKFFQWSTAIDKTHPWLKYAAMRGEVIQQNI